MQVQPLYEYVVNPATLTIHANANCIVLEHIGERRGGKLAALVGVEDLGAATARKSLLEGFYAKVTGQGVGGAPRQHLAAVEVQDGHQVDKALGHGQVGDVGSPYLI